jgi:hypothetical protein
VIDELQEGELRIAAGFAEGFQELVRFRQVQDIQRTPGLASPDVELASTLVEQEEEIVELERGWDLHPDTSRATDGGMIDCPLRDVVASPIFDNVRKTGSCTRLFLEGRKTRVARRVPGTLVTRVSISRVPPEERRRRRKAYLAFIQATLDTGVLVLSP